MRKLTFTFLSLLFLLHSSIAQTDSAIVRKTCTTLSCNKAPKIDGLLSDDVWSDAPVMDGFKQGFPIFGNVAKNKTEVKLVYDNTAIYVSAMLYDSSPDSIAHQLGNRDDDLSADLFQIKFDTYNAEQDAFVFGVSASGVQDDSRMSDGLYNAVWESAVKINDKGWSIEMKIPFSALRFPNKDLQLWGLQMTRSTFRSGEFDQWCLTPRGVTNFFKYWGFLKGLENVKQPIRLSLTPYITAYTSHYPSNIEGEKNYSSNITGGMDLKYGINESFTVDATLLPDFTQVQSDNVVKNLSAFEQQYDEQRPFFQESTDLFQKGNLFYSRRIGRRPSGYYNAYSQTNEKETIVKNPDQAKLLNATKVSGRTPNGMGIGLLNAVLDNTYATAKDSAGNERKILTEPFSNYNILVFDQQLKNGSDVYLINTNVNRQKGYNNADGTGAGLSLNNKKSTYNVSANGAISNILSKNDTAKNIFADLFGYKYDANISKISGNFQFTIGREAMNQTYNNNDMGITREKNYVHNGAGISLHRFDPYWRFLNAHLSFSINEGENFTTHQISALNFNLNANAQFKSFYGINFGTNQELESIDYYEARTEGRIFRRPTNHTFWGGMNTDGRKRLNANLNIYAGTTGLISPTIGYNPYYGINLNPNWRVNDKLSFNLSCNFSKDNGDRGYVNTDENGNIIFGLRFITTTENVLGVKYLFRNNLSLSLRVRHYWTGGHYKSFYNLSEEGYLIDNISYDQNHDFNFNAFNVDMGFQWQFAPGSSLNLVWKNSISDDKNMVIHDYGKNLTNTFDAKQLNTVSLKVLYYFDYLYLRKKSKKG
jgi:hypothetical protein